MSMHAFELPLRLQIGLNDKEHWGAKAKRVAAERLLVRQFFPWQLRKIAVGMAGQRLAVRLVRVAPRMLDSHDNLPGIFKPCVDQVAAELGLDDRDSRVSWAYGQERGKVRQYLVRVEVTATWPECPPGEQGGTAIAPKPQASGQRRVRPR